MTVVTFLDNVAQPRAAAWDVNSLTSPRTNSARGIRGRDVLSGSTGIIRPQLVNFPPVSVSGDPSRGSSACRILPKSQGDMVDMAHVRTFRWQRNNYWPLNVLIDKKCVGRHGDSMATWRWCRKIRRPTTRTNHSGVEFQTSAVEEPPRRNNSRGYQHQLSLQSSKHFTAENNLHLLSCVL
jgi:hypothetical protein